MRSKWVWLGLAIVLLGAILVRAGIIGDGSRDAADQAAITFGFTPWTTTYPGTYVAMQLIEDELGHPTNLERADVGVIYAGLARGDIDVFMDSWLPDLHQDYMNTYGESIEDVTVIYSDAILGWGVPSFVDEGVRSIADLNRYRELFGGRVVGIDPGAGMSRTSEEVIEAYDLDYEYVASSEAAMLTEMAAAFRENRPLLFLVYRPHSMFAKWDIRVLEDPRGIWSASEVHVVANANLAERAPAVHQFLQRFEMPLEDYEEWILQQDERGADPEDLARQWIDDNPERVQRLLEGL